MFFIFRVQVYYVEPNEGIWPAQPPAEAFLPYITRSYTEQKQHEGDLPGTNLPRPLYVPQTPHITYLNFTELMQDHETTFTG